MNASHVHRDIFQDGPDRSPVWKGVHCSITAYTRAAPLASLHLPLDFLFLVSQGTPRNLIPGVSASWIVHFTITDIVILEKRLETVLFRTW